MFHNTAENMLQFIKKSPSCFHAVHSMIQTLKEHGFEELCEGTHWKLTRGGSYFVTRNGSSLAAFTIPEESCLTGGFHIMASHSDSPTFKIKENPEIVTENHYVKLNVERYGGMLCAPWFDRPLSVAGRVVLKEENAFRSILVQIDRDLLLIPNLAIHMDRDANNGHPFHTQKELLPLYGGIASKNTFLKTVAEACNVDPDQILGHDLFLYNRQEGTIWGAQQEFVSSPRLDDLQCAWASLSGFLSGNRSEHICVHCVLDNEEVGSTTRQGAASTFLYDTLTRICSALSMSSEDYLISIANSFMISADNAHAVHPNFGEKSDPVNRPFLNEGIVIKYNAAQKYCTDALSAAVFKDLCQSAKVPFQTFTNHSDTAGGSTLGNISGTQVPVRTVDIGLPQLAMHSPYETAGVKDTWYLKKAAEVFFR